MSPLPPDPPLPPPVPPTSFPSPKTATTPAALSPSLAGAVPPTHAGEHHGDYGTDKLPITRHTYIYVFCAALNSCNLGYDIGVSTNAGHLLQAEWDLTDVQREMFVGSINFWSMFGALLAHFISDRYGRRRSFLVAAVGFIVGIIIMATAQSFAVCMIGRVFVGLGVGFGLAIDPLYIAEVSPAQHRGELVTWSEIFMNVGIVLGFTSGLVFYDLPDDKEWRWMFAAGAILPCVMIGLVLCRVLPESPRWLVSQRQPQEAKVILQTVYPENYNVDPVIEDIQEALQREEAAEHAVGWKVIWNPTPALRRMLWVGVGTAVAQQAVGIDAIQYYLIDVLDESGVESEKAQLVILIILGLVKLAFILVGGMLFDRMGRRPLFFVSLTGMAAALLLISITFFGTSKESSGFAIFGLALYLAFFSTGMGPGAWLIPSEVFANCIRAKAMSVATFANRATAFLMSSTFLSTASAISWAGFFMMLAGICVVVLVFLYFLLPETKGRSLEEMSVYFAEVTGDESILRAEAELLRGRNPTVEVISSVGGEGGGGGDIAMSTMEGAPVEDGELT